MLIPLVSLAGHVLNAGNQRTNVTEKPLMSVNFGIVG